VVRLTHEKATPSFFIDPNEQKRVAEWRGRKFTFATASTKYAFDDKAINYYDQTNA